MKIYIVGSIKIDSKWRKKLFINNLTSLEPISSLIFWNFNIDGKYAEFSRREIMKRYNDVNITVDGESSYYQLIKAQISGVNAQYPESLLFFWQEDHWFICPHKDLFLYLLDKFQKSKAEKLTITHLVELWEHKRIHKLISDKPLYKEYLVSLDSQRRLWNQYPGSYLTTLPTIYKKGMANEILEMNKDILENSKKSKNFELHDKRAVLFLSKRNFIEMIPNFHVLREVFRFNQEQRAMNMKQALQMIRLREKQERLQYFGIWTKIINMILAPRLTGGIIKRKIKKVIWKNHLFLL